MMTTKSSFSARLQDLSRQHFNRAINLDEYRRERRKVLDAIDCYFNGSVDNAALQTQEKREDATVPYRLENKAKF